MDSHSLAPSLYNIWVTINTFFGKNSGDISDSVWHIRATSDTSPADVPGSDHVSKWYYVPLIIRGLHVIRPSLCGTSNTCFDHRQRNCTLYGYGGNAVWHQVVNNHYSGWCPVQKHSPYRLLNVTHWGRVTHICVSKLTIIGSDNGLSPGRRQAMIWTNAVLLSFGPLGTNFSQIVFGPQIFSFKKMHLKMSSGKCWSFSPGPNVLRYVYVSMVLV